MSSVLAIARPHPLQSDLVRCDFPVGSSIAEMVGPNALFVRVEIGGMTIPEEWWPRIRPHAGVAVYITRYPQGGGGFKNILRLVAFAALAIGVILVSGGTALGGVGASLGAFLGTSAAVGSGLLAAGIGLVGSLIINALIPPTSSLPGSGSTSSTDSLRSITGTSNQVNRFGAIPCVVGITQMYPVYAAQPWTEYSGDDQYLRCLFDGGSGTGLLLSDMKIGDTDIATYTDVEAQIGSQPLLFSQDILEAPAGNVIADGDVVTHTTGVAANEVSVDLVWASGLFGLDSNGNTTSTTASLRLEYSPTGTGVWTTPPASALSISITFPGAYFDGSGNLLVTNSARKAVRVGVRWVLQPVGQYDVRITRNTTNYGGAAADQRVGDLTWTVLRTIRYTPASHTDTTKVALRIKANDQLNGSISQFNMTAAQAIPVWAPTGGSFVVSVSARSMPWTFSSTLNPAYSFGIGGGDPYMLPVHPGDVLTLAPAGTVSLGILYPGISPMGLGGPTGSNLGSTGHPFPTSHMPGSLLGLGGLCGAFTDSNGTILQLVSIGTGLTLTVPPGATQLQMGTNDDRYGDNTGTFNVTVSGSSAGVWVDRATENPAWIYRWLLKDCPANPRRVGAGRIDDAALIEWAAECEAKEFTFSTVLDQATTVFALLQNVCAAGRASFTMKDGRYSIVRDIPQTVPIQVFTPRNSNGFSGSRAFPDQVHALRVQFTNPEAAYQQDERVVYDDGYGDDAMVAANPSLILATKFEVFPIVGCTNANAAWRLGRYHLAVLRLRLNTYSWTADIENLVCSRGDLVFVANDVIGIGLAWGRIKVTRLDGSSNVYEIETDERVTFETGKTYAVQIRRSDRSAATSLVTSPVMDAETTLLQLTTPLANIEPGDLVVFGEYEKQTIPLVITKIEPSADFAAKITAVDASPAVLAADVGMPPAWTSQITGQPWLDTPPAPSAMMLNSNQYLSTPNDAGNTTATVSLTLLSGSRVTRGL